MKILAVLAAILFFDMASSEIDKVVPCQLELVEIQCWEEANFEIFTPLPEASCDIDYF